MITVVGKVGCSACVKLKEKLTEDKVEFDYILFDDIPRNIRKSYATVIREQNNGHFPLILNDEKVIHLDSEGNINV